MQRYTLALLVLMAVVIVSTMVIHPPVGSCPLNKFDYLFLVAIIAVLLGFAVLYILVVELITCYRHYRLGSVVPSILILFLVVAPVNGEGGIGVFTRIPEKNKDCGGVVCKEGFTCVHPTKFYKPEICWPDGVDYAELEAIRSFTLKNPTVAIFLVALTVAIVCLLLMVLLAIIRLFSLQHQTLHRANQTANMQVAQFHLSTRIARGIFDDGNGSGAGGRSTQHRLPRAAAPPLRIAPSESSPSGSMIAGGRSNTPVEDIHIMAGRRSTSPVDVHVPADRDEGGGGYWCSLA